MILKREPYLSIRVSQGCYVIHTHSVCNWLAKRNGACRNPPPNQSITGLQIVSKVPTLKTSNEQTLLFNILQAPHSSSLLSSRRKRLSGCQEVSVRLRQGCRSAFVLNTHAQNEVEANILKTLSITGKSSFNLTPHSCQKELMGQWEDSTSSAEVSSGRLFI